MISTGGEPGALSAALQADLVRYHEEFSAKPDRPLGEAPARLLLARFIDGLADARGAAATVIAGALDLLETGQTQAAAGLLRWALDRYADRPEGSTIQ